LDIVREEPHLNLFLGDSAYEHDATRFVDVFRSFYDLKEKTIFSKGNHDDKEDECNLRTIFAQGSGQLQSKWVMFTQSA
jgi:hypothetical protein